MYLILAIIKNEQISSWGFRLWGAGPLKVQGGGGGGGGVGWGGAVGWMQKKEKSKEKRLGL